MPARPSRPLLITALLTAIATALLSFISAGYYWNVKFLGYDALGISLGGGGVGLSLIESDATIGVNPLYSIYPMWPRLLPKCRSSTGGFPGGVHIHTLAIPVWMFTAPLLIWQLRTTRRDNHKPVHCPRCDYDVASLTAAQCPECGFKIPLRPGGGGNA